ncbi:hypothetical protein SESBI_06479 [Sesbania bispinosa]|nr:hypothetical protein SESBI_06479 [Sesbania bispinosa]
MKWVGLWRWRDFERWKMGLVFGERENEEELEWKSVEMSEQAVALQENTKLR